MLTFPFPLTIDILQRIRQTRAEGRISLAATVSTDWTTVVSLNLTSIERGFITSFGLDVDDPQFDYNGSILFRLTLDGQPINNFSSFQLQQGSIIIPSAVMIYMQPGDTFALQARRAVGVSSAQTIDGICSGHAWPQKYCLPFHENPTVK